MTVSDESWFAVQLERAGEAAEDADLSSRLAALLAWLDFLTEEAAKGMLSEATRRALVELIDQQLKRLAALLEAEKAA